MLHTVNSIVKSHFAWNWQSATLNRGDELVCLSLAFLQPLFFYTIRFADLSYSNSRPVGMSREIFGVPLGLFWDTKTANADVRIFSRSPFPVLTV